MIKSQHPPTEPETSPSPSSSVGLDTVSPSASPVESPSENPSETSLPEGEAEEKPKFQGIGTLFGKVYQDEEQGFFIKLGQNEYRLYILKNRYRSWLLQMKNAPDTPLYLRVYPKYRIIPRKPPEVYFQVVAWVEENQWEEPGMFVFRGIWQFIPQIRTPVISVYRNYEADDPTEKFKAVHLPILMRREDDTRPFKFNPKIPKEQLPKRWFIQAEFKFIPSRDCWGWVKDVDQPTDHIPRYRKPVKAALDKEQGVEDSQGMETKPKAENSDLKPQKPFNKPTVAKKPTKKSSEES